MRHWRLGGKPRHRPAHAMPTAWFPRWPQVAAAAIVPAAAVLALISSHPAPVTQHGPVPKVAGAATDQAGAEHDLGLVGATGDASGLPIIGGDPTPTTSLPAVPSSSAVAVRGAESALAGDGIPQTALSAYENAASLAGAQYPSCRIPWPLLAGIGRVESDHGRFGGAVLYADGTSSRPIIGIPLDGSRSARISDTDGGRLDGDPVYDRAVGPMQFIPSTWASYGVDGNGDGKADPFNIFDAARAAADYLCVAGGDLSTMAGQTRAVLAYNHSSAYLAEVLGLERAYAAGVAGLVIPVGPAAPPSPTSTPTIPPVDPGPPLGSGSEHPPTSSAPPPSSSSAATSGAPASSSSSRPTSAPPSSAPPSSSSTSACPSPSETTPTDPSTSTDPTDSPTTDVPSTAVPTTNAAPPSMPVVDPAADAGYPQSADLAGDTSSPSGTDGASSSASGTAPPTC